MVVEVDVEVGGRVIAGIVARMLAGGVASKRSSAPISLYYK